MCGLDAGGVLYQKDYILRMIEQIGQVLIELRKMILGRAGSPAEVHDELKAAVSRGGLDLELITSADADTVVLMIAPSGEIEPGRCWLAAETLYLHGLNAAVDGRPDEARPSFEKAIRLYRLPEPMGAFLVGLPEAGERIREIEEELIPPRP